MKKFVAFLKAYFTAENVIRILKQPSTARAAIALIGLLGYQIAPEHIESIVQGALGLFVVYEGLRDGDKKVP